MQSKADALDKLGKLYAAQGCLFIARLGRLPPLAVGEIVPSGSWASQGHMTIGQPMRVTGIATEAEFTAQSRAMGVPYSPDPAYSQFYRMETD